MGEEKAEEDRGIKRSERDFYNKEREKSDREVEENYESWIGG